jgi:hypothetical protein
MKVRMHVRLESLKRRSVDVWKRGSVRVGAFTHLRIYASTLLLFLSASTAAAQNEQWLQYRWANEARQIVGDMGYVYHQASPTRPAGVKLPEFTSEQPVFMEWKTPMAASGSVWLAFDRSTSGGQYDRLYIDANADGDLSDEQAHQPHRRESYMSVFGPLKIVFDTEDGPVTYHLTAELRFRSGETPYCLLSPACWYEGPVTVGGKKLHCVLIDYNVNGVFNDKSADFGQSDRIRIGEEGSRDTRFVGNFIEIGDKLYRPQIAKDGAFIILTEAPDVTYGAVRVAEGITSFGAGGINGLFFRKPENGIVKLPAGDYRVEHWSIVRDDDRGAKWELRGSPARERGAFSVAQDRSVELPFGEPIRSQAEYRQTGSVYNFSQSLQGRHGEQITLLRNGSQPPPPRLRIRSRGGAYERALSFEYG